MDVHARFGRSALIGWVFLVLNSFAALGAPPASADLEAQLKNALKDFKKSIPTLSESATKIFDIEVMALAPLFIRDYRANSAQPGLLQQVDVDRETVLNYLKFNEEAVSRGSAPNKKFILAASIDASCAQCARSAPSIKKVLEIRLNRRGFSPQWVKLPESVISRSMRGKSSADPALEWLQEQMRDAGAAGGGVLSLEQLQADADDVAHADEERFQSRSWFVVAGLPPKKSAIEFYSSERFDAQVSKQWVEATCEFGAALEGGAKGFVPKTVGQSSEEPLGIEVLSIRSLAQLQEVRAKLQELLVPSSADAVYERMISSSSVTFTVRTKQGAESIRQKLAGLPATLASARLIRVEWP